MAMTIIIKDDHGKQVEISVELADDKNWEEKCYQIACEVAREMAKPVFNTLWNPIPTWCVSGRSQGQVSLTPG